MSTTQRLGIDITAKNKTGAAFAAVERSMQGLNSSFNQFKAGLAAIGISNVFERFISGIVRVNTENGRGKVAADELTSSFQNFALQVGQAGLIEGLENFAGALQLSSREANGLATVTGQALGGALTGLGNALPAIAAEFKDLGAAFGIAADKASTLAQMSGALDEFFRKYGPFSQNAQDGFFGAFDSSGKTSLPPGTLDRSLPKPSFTASMNDVNEMLKSIGDASAKVTKPVAKKVVPPGTIEDIYGTGNAVSALEVNFQEAIDGAGQFSDALFSLGDAITGSIGSALAGLIDGTMSVKDAFSSMATDILSTMADLAAQMMVNSAFKLLMGSDGGGGGAGLDIGGMTFGGLFASGGTLGAGKWGIAGEAGPEIIHGPARITPMEAGRTGSIVIRNNVVNNSSANVQTRAQQGSDGSIHLETIVEDKMIDTAGGGRFARVMGGRFGARVMPRRV